MICGDSDKPHIVMIQHSWQMIASVDVSEIAIFNAVFGKHLQNFGAGKVTPNGRKMQKNQYFLRLLRIL